MAALRFYWVVTAAGAVLMALEIVSSRVLAPHFGSSVYVWGSIISVFLAALSIGYAWGGRLADRFPSVPVLGRALAACSLCLALLLFAGETVAARIGELTGGGAAGTLLATTALFAPATLLLAMVSPWAVRLAARDLGHLGHTAGRLFALSAAGSLAGTLLATFVLIPYLDLGRIFGLLLLVTALTAMLALAGDGIARNWRRERPALLVAAGLSLLAVSRLGAADGYGDAVYKRLTPYQTLEVVDRDGVRYLLSDNVNHAAIRLDDRRPALSYTRLLPAALLLEPEVGTFLALGMGAGNAGSYLRGALPELAVEYVEIDPAVPQVAQRFFGFEEMPATAVHVADARRFLEATERRWDLILCDTYIGMSVPFHLTTIEFFDLVRRRLTAGGVLEVNLAGTLDDPFPRAIYRTLSERFDTIYAFRASDSRNVLLVARAGGPRLSDEELLARARDLDPGLELELPLASLVLRRVAVDLEADRAPLLSDAFAPVERLISMGPDGVVPGSGS